MSSALRLPGIIRVFGRAVNAVHCVTTLRILFILCTRYGTELADPLFGMYGRVYICVYVCMYFCVYACMYSFEYVFFTYVYCVDVCLC